MVYWVIVPKYLQLADTEEEAVPLITNETGTVYVGVKGSFEFIESAEVYVPAVKPVELKV